MKPAAAEPVPTSERMAIQRTLLAYDRTLLAWVRTAVALISFGFTLFKFFQYLGDHGMVPQIRRAIGPAEFSVALIFIGNLALLLATIHYLKARRKMKQLYGEEWTRLTAVLAVIAALFGIGILGVTLLGL